MPAYILLLLLATWMYLKAILLSEESQPSKVTDFLVSLYSLLKF